MLTEQDVFIADSQDIKEATDEVKEDCDSYVSDSNCITIVGLILTHVACFSAGCIIVTMLHKCLCVGG